MPNNPFPPHSLRRARTAALRYEREQLARGFTTVFGLDEAGRGAWAGPVVAAAVCLPLHLSDDDLTARLRGVKDSKQMTARQRAAVVGQIQTVALAWGVGEASATEIDALGIAPATGQAMLRAWAAAVERLGRAPDAVLLDTLPWRECPIQEAVENAVRRIKRGDQHSLTVAAASVLAKTHRDALMTALAADYPVYGFAQHKGYGTQAHAEALLLHGPSPLHRRTFGPIRLLVTSAK